uniref:Bm13410 n=1 Tax=Brugia malayi TaxID=6279 RepID=A0A0J9XRS4_BRUMA|nr:Bm13410 [Brugia malayi]
MDQIENKTPTKTLSPISACTIVNWIPKNKLFISICISVIIQINKQHLRKHHGFFADRVEENCLQKQFLEAKSKMKGLSYHLVS